MLRHPAFRATVLASGMLGALLVATAPARAKEIQHDQRITGLGVQLNPLNADFVVEFKGAPGRASGRMLVKLGAPDFEGASGTFSMDLVGVGLTPLGAYPSSLSASGSLTGTIVIDD